MFRHCRFAILGLAIIAVAETNLCAQRTPRQRGWSYSGDPRAERTPNFRLPMEALLSANSPEDLIRAGTQPGRIPAPRAVAKPQTPAPAANVESLPDEEVDPFADDPLVEAAPASEANVVATEPATPADDGLTGGQLLGVLGDVAGSFLPDTSRVTGALPQLPGAGPPGGAPSAEMGMPPAAGAAPSDAANGADPFSAPADGADPFGGVPADSVPQEEGAPTTDAVPMEDDPFAAGSEEPAVDSPDMEADPFQ